VKIVSWSIEKVLPYPGNPRRNADAVAKVAASLTEFGWRQPIVVDRAGVVVAGHTRLLAAQSLGMAHVPVHVATGLTPAQVRAYRLADNRTADEAEWDGEKLRLELRAIRESGDDLAQTGFGGDEIETLLRAEVKDPDADELPALPECPVTRPGDVIRLGRHILVCGDSSDIAVQRAALARHRADCVWTDPPYGVAVVGRTKRKLTIQNDGADPAALAKLLEQSLGAALELSAPGAPWYVAAPAGPQFLVFAQFLGRHGIWRQTLVWVKQVFVLGHSDYHYQHEDIFYGWAPGRTRLWYGDRKRSTVLRYDRIGSREWFGPERSSSVLEFDRPSRSADHPTTKPVALVLHCLGNSARTGAHVLDPFAGSGTTLLACDGGGQVAHCVELDPRYCDVIVTRWERATGLTADRGHHNGNAARTAG
jgi:DNA modification methylase